MPQALPDRLEEVITQILAYIPFLALALGILIGGFAIAKIVERGTAAGLRRIGFDRWMREGGVTEALARAGTELDPSGVLAKLVFWAVMLVVILFASDALGLVIVSALFAELLAYIPMVIAAVIILILGIVLGEFVKKLVLASAGAMAGVPTLARAAKAAVILLAVFMALGQLGIAEPIVLVAFIAVAGAAALAAGIAFGLGARDLAGELAREWYERSRAPRESAARHGRESPAAPAADRTGTPPPPPVEGDHEPEDKR
jgi:small-conductance mechanosensitive channel